ncbi:hypothetical protein ACO0QE_002434 [Hanseniaspora vineae]
MVNFSFLGGNTGDKENTDDLSTESFQLYKDKNDVTDDNLTNDPNVQQLQQQVLEANKKINDLLSSGAKKYTRNTLNEASGRYSGHSSSSKSNTDIYSNENYINNCSNQKDQMLLKQLRLGKPGERASQDHGTTSSKTYSHGSSPVSDNQSISKLWSVVRDQQTEVARLNNELYMEKLKTDKLSRDHKNLENEMYNMKNQMQLLNAQMESLQMESLNRVNTDYNNGNHRTSNYSAGNYNAKTYSNNNLRASTYNNEIQHANNYSNSSTPTLLDDTQYLLSTSPSSFSNRQFSDIKINNSYSTNQQPTPDLDSTTELIKGANKYINKYR